MARGGRERRRIERYLFGSTWAEVERQLGADQRTARVAELLRRQFADPRLDLASAARAAHAERNYLNRLLRHAAGTTFRRLLVAYRLHRALPLLADTDRTTVDIAHACGFGSVRAFERASRRLLGVTPGGLRRDLRSASGRP